MKKKFVLTLGLVLGLVTVPIALPTPAFAQSVSITIGTNLNRGRGISCNQGERLLRNRGFRDIRRIDCRGRFFVYRAWRGNSRFEISVRQSNGRVVDVRRISSMR